MKDKGTGLPIGVQLPVMLKVPLTRQTALRLPWNPALQLPLQAAPIRMGVLQLNAPLKRFGGLPAQPGCANTHTEHVSAQIGLEGHKVSSVWLGALSAAWGHAPLCIGSTLLVAPQGPAQGRFQRP